LQTGFILARSGDIFDNLGWLDGTHPRGVEEASVACGILMASMNRLEFQALAVERLSDADALLEAGRYACAYYIAGYAVECALKACIARKTNQDDFPSREAARYYVHDLPKLLDGAGLGLAFEQDARQDEILGKNWAAVKDWTEETRY
jgi:HEPN domain-containing protein